MPVNPPSGIDYIDRMCAEQSRADRAAAIRQRMEAEWIDFTLKKGPRIESEYNPLDNARLKK